MDDYTDKHDLTKGPCPHCKLTELDVRMWINRNWTGKYEVLPPLPHECIPMIKHQRDVARKELEELKGATCGS